MKHSIFFQLDCNVLTLMYYSILVKPSPIYKSPSENTVTFWDRDGEEAIQTGVVSDTFQLAYN